MPRKAQLVCQHLENISRQALQDYQSLIKAYVRRRQGVYALYRRNKLYYVGLASSLQGRLKSHLRDRHADSWDRFSVYITIGDQHLKELESLVLRVVKPTGNKQKGKFVKSEDLRRRLKCDLRDFQKIERDTMFGTSSGQRQVARLPKTKQLAPRGTSRTPIMSRFVTKPIPIRAKHKGKTLKARINKDGTIRYAGNLYNSPSLAGAAAVGRKTCNGWDLWKFQRAPGDWVKLNTLRK